MADFNEIASTVQRVAMPILVALNERHPDAGWRWGYSENLRQDLLQIPEYEDFLQIAKTNELFKIHLGKFIGSSIHATWYSDVSIFVELLRRAYDEETRSIVPARLRTELGKLFHFVSSNKIDAELIMPLYGLHLSQGSFPINEHTSLTGNEAAKRWSAYDPYLQKAHPLHGDEPSSYLRIMYGILKCIRGRDEAPEVDADWRQKNDLEQRAELVLSALKSVLPRPVAHGPIAHIYYDWNEHSSSTWKEVIPLHFIHQDFGPSQFQAFITFWRRLEASIARHPAIRIALSRMRLATERQVEEDKTIDLLIAAEALFLSDSGTERGELGHRIALRAGKFLGKTPVEQRAIYENMKRIYRFRSAIIHGAHPSVPKGLASHSDLNTLLESYMRMAIKQAVSLDAPEKIFKSEFWDDLMFGL